MTPAAPVRAAVAGLQTRLTLISEALITTASDGDLMAHLGDLEAALTSAGVALGLARREIALRTARGYAAFRGIP